MSKRRLLIPLLLTSLAMLAVAQPAAAGPRNERCFYETTGYCISGAIRAYWENNGGLAAFGYPITGEGVELVEGTWTGPVQWFERDRLENHSNEGLGVLAGRLGARYLELRGTPWAPGPGGSPAGPGCLSAAPTGYELCGAFRAYWEQRGGLERFGYPISAPATELIEGKPYTVQYFERRRMERHPEYAGTPYEVLLGLLGRDVHRQELEVACPAAPAVLQATANYYRARIGCPSPGLRTDVPTSWQPFEGGMMLWVQNEGARGGKIYVVAFPGSRVFDDTYVDGEPVNTDVVPPPGLYVPYHGFGKLWRDNPWVRSTMGYPTLPERGDVGLVQPFDDGRAQMIYRSGQDMVLTIFRADSSGVSPASEMPPVR